MSIPRFEDFEEGIEELLEAQEITSAGALTTKLERRRRIEDLEEERRLRKELCEY